MTSAVSRLLSRGVPPGGRVLVYALALAGFVGAVVVRGGPSLGDAYGVTKPAAALAHGDLHAAAHLSVLPQPPGYAELSTPFVAAFEPWVGKVTWCDGRVPVLLTKLIGLCAPAQLPSSRWYESQAVLAIVAWVVLVAGATALLRAAGAGRNVAEMILVMALAAVPAGQDGVVETFHPQDLVCVGLSAAALACALRRRWLGCGVLFGVAFLCKQFALLPLIATVVIAPTWRARATVAAAAAVVVGVGVAPFFVVDPSGTWSILGAVNTGGVVKVTTGTVLGLTGLTEKSKLVIARDGPLVLALVMSLWALRRARRSPLTPVGFVGLATACLAARLVCEVGFASYYLLATSAALLALDLAARRLPVVSLAWIVATSILVEQAGGFPTTAPAAGVAFAASLVAVATGLHAVWRGTSASGVATEARGDAPDAAHALGAGGSTTSDQR